MKFKKILIPVITGIILFLVLLVFLKNRRYVTGHEWYKMQDEYMNSFETLADDMDDTLSLYIADSISTEDFLTHVYIMQQELSLLELKYNAYEKKHPIRTGTYTKQEKRAVEAVRSLFGVFHNILDMMEANAENKDVLAYDYIGYHQDAIKYVTQYTTAKNFIDGTWKLEEGG